MNIFKSEFKIIFNFSIEKEVKGKHSNSNPQTGRHLTVCGRWALLVGSHNSNSLILGRHHPAGPPPPPWLCPVVGRAGRAGRAGRVGRVGRAAPFPLCVPLLWSIRPFPFVAAPPPFLAPRGFGPGSPSTVCASQLQQPMPGFGSSERNPILGQTREGAHMLAGGVYGYRSQGGPPPASHPQQASPRLFPLPTFFDPRPFGLAPI